MKQLSFLLVFVFISFIVTTLALSDDSIKKGDMTIQSAEFGEFQRSHVDFNHGAHEKTFLCKECHHNSDLFLDKKNVKAARCSSCHEIEETAEVPVSLTDAFHGKCKACHTKYVEWGKELAGPVMCGSCHKR